MTIAASAFPRLSPSGLRVVAGERTLVLDKTFEIGPGTSAQWADETSLYYTRQPDGAFMRWDGASTVVRASGFNAFSAGGPARWAGYSAARSAVEFDNGTVVPGWSAPALSADPGVWAAVVHVNGRLITGIGTPAKYASASCRDLRFCGRALAWNVFVDGRWQIAGMRQPTETPELLNIDREEFWPVPLLVEGDLWLMTHSHDRLLLRPWGSREGYVVATGITNTPDAKQLPNGRVRVVWDAGHNVLEDVSLDPQTPRVDLDAPVVTPRPVEDTSGQPIDLWPYFLPPEGVFPRTSHEPGHGHEMHCVFDGRNFWTLPFGEPDHWVRMVVEGDTLTFREDRSRDGQNTGDYSFTHGLWARRVMRVGDRIVNTANNLVRYQPDGCRVVDVHAFPFRTGLWKRWTSFDCGGHLGWQDVIAYLYDPGGLADTFELSYFARGSGFFRWEEYDQKTDQRRHWTTFNEFGGRAPRPTQGCWTREHLALRPNGTDPPNEDGMTKDELIGTAIDRGFVLGAWTRFINEVALGRDVIDGTTREDNLTDTVGTRGLAMYFFPLYYRATMQAIDRLGRVPRNAAEWGGVSIAGFETAKAVYLREQGGGGGGGGPVDPGPVGPSIITGRLRKEGRALADDAGYALPVFCHSGTGIADLLYDEATERHNASLIKSVGFAGRRVWTRLRGTAPWSTNPQGWAGREFGHETMGDDAYRNLLITSFRQHQELGLKLALSAGDIEGIDNEHEIRKYVQLLGDALEAVSPDGSLCSIFESGNELPGIWRNGSPERARDWILKPFKARFPGVLCTNSQGANESREERFRWCLDPADLDDIHSFRDNRWYDWIRHVINNAYVHEHGTQPRELIWGSEPFGTGGLVSVQPNIHEFDEQVAQISVIAHLMTGQIPCYFCSPGIRFDVARDLYGETYESMPGFATCAAVAKLLPADIMTWPRENIVHGGREDPPGSPNPIFQEPGTGEIDRAYHVFSEDHRRFAALIFGGESLDSRPYRPYTADVDVRFGNKARLVVGQAQ